MDKARVNLGRISEFGMLEMSRQRIAKTLNDAIHLECPHCEGRGKVKSVEAMALSFLRKVHGAAAKGTVAEVRGGLPLEVAYYLLNRKKRELTQIENDYEIEVTVKGKTSYLLNQLELETVKRETPRLEDVIKSAEEADEAPQPQPRFNVSAAKPAGPATSADVGGLTEAGGKKRKRRRKKKKGAADGVAGEVLSPVAMPAIEDERHDETSGAGEDATPVDGAKTKKRRRKKKKGGAETTLPEHAAPAAETVGADEQGLAGEELKPKKRRRRRARKGGKSMEETMTAETALPAVQAPEPAPVAVPEKAAAPQKKRPKAEAVKEEPKKARAPRAKKVLAAAPEVSQAAAAEPVATAVAAPKKPRRAAAKKVAAPAPSGTEAPAEPEVAAPKAAPRPRRPKKVVDVP
jgi:ribonuclease E